MDFYNRTSVKPPFNHYINNTAQSSLERFIKELDNLYAIQFTNYELREGDDEIYYKLGKGVDSVEEFSSIVYPSKTIARRRLANCRQKNTKNFRGEKIPFILSGVSVAIYFTIVFYSFNHLPIIDFRPYKIGF